jgi:hypothetical protein
MRKVVASIRSQKRLFQRNSLNRTARWVENNCKERSWLYKKLRLTCSQKQRDLRGKILLESHMIWIMKWSCCHCHCPLSPCGHRLHCLNPLLHSSQWHAFICSSRCFHTQLYKISNYVVFNLWWIMYIGKRRVGRTFFPPSKLI